MELFSGSERGMMVEEYISKAKSVFTTAISLAEVASAVERRKKPAEKAYEIIQGNSRIVLPTAEDSVKAGKLHAEMKARTPNFGLADSFVLQLARKIGARVLTGDPDFRGIKEAELLT
jgi:predicted nucleic acid-binding protein